MNIVFVIDTFDLKTNGTVMTACRFVENLRKHGHRVKVVGTGAEGEDCYNMPERYIPIVTEVSRKQKIRFSKADLHILMNAFSGADLIHFFLPFKLEKVGKKLADKMGIPSTAAFHLQPENILYNMGLKWFNLGSKFLYFAFRRRFYRKFDHIHCPSRFIAGELKKHKYKAKLHIISNGVDNSFKPADEPRKEDGFFNILMVGRYATEKRQDVLIKAVSLSKYKDKIKLTLAGQGPLQKKLEKLAQNLPNKVNFGFLEQSELQDVIHNSDLYVHAADVEIEAIACIEAFACGLVPVIADSKKSATSQFALDKRSLFKAGDPKDLASKIDYWIEHKDERLFMSQKYIESGKTYGIDYSISKAEEMFNEAILDFRASSKNDKKTRKLRKKIMPKGKIFRFFAFLFYYVVAVPILSVYLFFMYGIKVKGKNNLKELRKSKSGAVTISNHVHYVDCAMVALGVFPKKVIFTSLESNFNMPVAGTLIKMLGGVPVSKRLNEIKIMHDEVVKQLKLGRFVQIYPEGHLINYYEGIREFYKGAFKIACDAQVPVIPIGIKWREPKGFFKIYKKKPCATVLIGKPVYADYRLLRKDMEFDLKARCEKAMENHFSSSSEIKDKSFVDNNLKTVMNGNFTTDIKDEKNTLSEPFVAEE